MFKTKQFILIMFAGLFLIATVFSFQHIDYVGWWIIVPAGMTLIAAVAALNLDIYYANISGVNDKVLRNLNPGNKKGYQVVCRVHDVIGHAQVMLLIDLSTQIEHSSVIKGPYPPIGFFEKKTPQGTFILLPGENEKKLVWGWGTRGGEVYLIENIE